MTMVRIRAEKDRIVILDPVNGTTQIVPVTPAEGNKTFITSLGQYKPQPEKNAAIDTLDALNVIPADGSGISVHDVASRLGIGFNDAQHQLAQLQRQGKATSSLLYRRA